MVLGFQIDIAVSKSKLRQKRSAELLAYAQQRPKASPLKNTIRDAYSSNKELQDLEWTNLHVIESQSALQTTVRTKPNHPKTLSSPPSLPRYATCP